MKTKIIWLVLLWGLGSCRPVNRERGDPSGKNVAPTIPSGKDVTPTIDPDGEWNSSCVDDSSKYKSKSGKKLNAVRRKIIFSQDKGTFSLVTDYLSESCQKQNPKVEWSEYVVGRITFGTYNKMEEKLSRQVEISLTKLYSLPKTDFGVEYLKATTDASDLKVNQELVVKASDYPHKKLYGVLIVGEKITNVMYVFLTPSGHIEDPKGKDVPDNRYVQN